MAFFGKGGFNADVILKVFSTLLDRNVASSVLEPKYSRLMQAWFMDLLNIVYFLNAACSVSCLTRLARFIKCSPRCPLSVQFNVTSTSSL